MLRGITTDNKLAISCLKEAPTELTCRELHGNVMERKKCQHKTNSNNNNIYSLLIVIKIKIYLGNIFLQRKSK